MNRFDCIVIGYSEVPFPHYESFRLSLDMAKRLKERRGLAASVNPG